MTPKLFRGTGYTISDDEGQVTVLDSAGEPFAEVSDIIANPLDQNEFLSVDFKSVIRDGIIDRQEKRFTLMKLENC